MSEKETIQKLMDEAVTKLSEHCDSVHIFVTKHAMDGNTDHTAALDKGAGSFYAKLGQVQEWLCIQTQYQKNEAIRRDNESTDE